LEEKEAGGDPQGLPMHEDPEKYGVLARLFQRIKRPVIFSRDLLRESVYALTNAIGPGPGKASIELEEIGKEAEITALEVGPLEGGKVRFRAASRRLKITLEKTNDDRILDIEIDEGCEEENGEGTGD